MEASGLVHNRFVIEFDGSRATLLALPFDLADRVEEAEYARLLGYPDRRVPGGLAAATARRARDWFRRHADPWVLTRPLPITRIGGKQIELEGSEILTSRFLARRLRRARADTLVVALVSAGREADRRSAALWGAGRPDEAYFSDRFAAAVVEYLATWTGDRVRRTLRRRGRGLMGSYGPGYPGWALGQMVGVGRCLGDGDRAGGRFEILDSGMIRPVNSLLAVFGVTPDLDAADRSWQRSGCAWCALTGCDSRRP